MRTDLRRTGTLVGSLGLASAITLAGLAPAHADDDRLVIADGAVVLFDVVTRDDSARLEMTTGGASLAPGSADIVIDGDAARRALPDQLPAEYSGIVDPGTTVYQVPGAPTEGLPSLGWSTERVPLGGDGQAPSAAVSIDVAGPGSVVVYGANEDGSLVPYVDTRDDEPDHLELPHGTTGWPAWVFAEPGSYVVEAQPTLSFPDGTAIDGPAVHYRIQVTEPTPPAEPEDPLPVEPVDPPDGEGSADPGRQPPAGTPASPPPTGSAGSGADAQVMRESTCDVPGLAADAIVAADGHYDYGVQVQNGALRARVKDDRTDPPLWRRPESVVFSLGDAAEKQVPASAAYSFLGAAGDPVWTIGQTQEDDVPWLGWNTQHASATANIDGATTWRIDSVEGPGELYLYQTGSFGSVSKIMSTAAGWPRSTRIPADTHVHGNWTFTEPGVYRVSTTHSAALNDGRMVSNQDTLFFQVGPCAGSEPPGPDPDAPPNGDQGPTDDDTPDDPPPSDAPAPELPSTGPSSTTIPTRCSPSTADDTDGADGADDDGTTQPGEDQPARQDPVSEGHFDFGPEVVGGELVARVKDDRTQPPSWVDPESIRFVLGDTAQQQVPDGSAYSFLGDAGDPIWLMPQTQAAGVPWLGWNTQHESVRSGVRGSVRFTLDSVSGPGELAVYLTDSFGGVGQKVFGSVGGFPRSLSVPLNVHAHGNWVFTAAGDYEVAITQSATLTDGTAVSGQGTLHFTVGGDAPSGRTKPSAATTGDRSIVALPVLATVATQDQPDPDETETDSEESATDETGGDDAGAEGDCVLPDTGSPAAAALLLPLGLVLVVLGGGLVVRSRRATCTTTRGA